jgi:predicted RNA polymerase sigma factor
MSNLSDLRRDLLLSDDADVLVRCSTTGEMVPLTDHDCAEWKRCQREVKRLGGSARVSYDLAHMLMGPHRHKAAAARGLLMICDASLPPRTVAPA